MRTERLLRGYEKLGIIQKYVLSKCHLLILLHLLGSPEPNNYISLNCNFQNNSVSELFCLNFKIQFKLDVRSFSWFGET